jgi:hypothetical protein
MLTPKMLTPDFNKYSIALIKTKNNSEEIIYESKGSRIRPLFDCVNKFKSKEKECILHDKVIGLAAARLIVYSKFISFVKTNLLSKPAKDYLELNNISVEYNILTDNILNNDQTGLCPMENKALQITDDEQFFKDLEKIFKPLE